jgi:DNA repair protein RadD
LTYDWPHSSGGDARNVGAVSARAGIPPVDWQRTEDLFEAIASKVGVLGCDLRPYQAGAIIRIRSAYSDGARRIMFQSPTGSGKTRIASAIIAGVVAADRPVLFVTPSVDLVDQTVEKLFREGIRDIGVMQASHPMTRPSRIVQVASVQTLQRRTLPPADLVFIDEAHWWSSFYGKWMLDLAWRDVPFIGLSATPWREGLGAYYDKLVVATTPRELINAKHLSDFRMFAPARPDLRGVKTVAGDYDAKDLGVAMNKPHLVADIVETWEQLAYLRPTLCFCVNRAHAQHIADRFEQAGYRCGYVDGETPRSERAEVRQKFASGEYQIVCNVNCLTIGIDWDVRCIIFARPTKSEMLYVQIIGRGLRPARGKDHCLILDHSDNALRLGFPDEIHHDQLHDGKIKQHAKADNIKLPKQCPKCAYLRPASTPTCPNCGFTAKPINKITNSDGELQELRRSKGRTLDEKTTFFAELLWIEREGLFSSSRRKRPYKRGFAEYKFRDKFGQPPPDRRYLQPQLPRKETEQWVLSRLIAFAKAQREAAP